MKTTLLILFLISFVSAQMIAQAIIKGTALDPTIRGKVTFVQANATHVAVLVNITGIATSPDAVHGMHVHIYGDISDKNASSTTGGHFVGSGGFNHSCPENGPNRHFGDMGNWQAAAGSIVQLKTLDLLTLSGFDSIIGRAVVLHAMADDCVTAPTGASGGRLAHGVIGLVNSTVYGGSGMASSGYNASFAICNLESSAGSNVTGTVWFTQTASGVLVQAEVFNITGNHGFHLHWFGDISDPAGLATSGHFNPNNSLHGVPPFGVRHYGDMGIIYHYKAGVAYYQYTNDYLSLVGANSIIGRAVHVHANSDDCVNPIGNGGARYAQCVIGIIPSINPTVSALFTDVPSTQNGTAICGNLPSSTTSAATSASGTATSASGTATSAGNTNITVSTRGTTSVNTNQDSPATIISMTWALLAVAFAFCL